MLDFIRFVFQILSLLLLVFLSSFLLLYGKKGTGMVKDFLLTILFLILVMVVTR
jgi:hypothetical protein